MAVTQSGDVVDTIATDGDLWVGNTGTGSLTVDGGSVKSITAAGTGSTGAEARLWIGRPSTGNGTVTVNGASSVLEVVSGGRQDAGGTAQIGRGGTGSLTVEAGATFRILDAVGTAYDYANGIGNEGINVGREAGGNGTLTVNNGHVVVSGTGAFMNIGRGGGTGNASFTNGSTLDMSSTLATADVHIQVGRGSQGSLLLSASSATLTAGGAAATPTEDYGASINVGRDAGGNGTFTMQSGASLTLSGDSNLAGTTGSYTSLQIGRDGGTGVMTLGGSTVTLNNAPEGASLIVARNAVNGATTTGTLGLTASTITLDGTGFANFGIGRGTGTNGTATLYAASTIKVQGDFGANLQVGTTNNSANSTGGTGTLNINSLGGAASTVIIQSDNNGTYASANIGQFGGTGTVNVDGGTLRMQGAIGAFMQLGFQMDSSQPGNVAVNSAGTGSLILTNGARFEMIDGSGSNGLRLGNGAGTATMEVRSGSVADLDDDAAGGTFVGVGSGIAGSGAATLLVSGSGSRLEGVSSINVGQNTFEANNTGGNGHLIIENGGVVIADGGGRIGSGGRLSGNGGTLQMQSGNWMMVVQDGTVGDAGGAIQQLTVIGNIGLHEGANARFDISSSAQDRISAQVSGANSGTATIGAVDFDLNVLGGYKFTAEESRTFISGGAGTFVGIDFNTFASSTVTINGQHADFSYYLGALTGGNTFGLRALNSGATGGTSTFDFGASNTLSANFTYYAGTNTARVTGGTFAEPGGLTVGVDAVLGTAVNDTFNVSQSTSSMVLDGRDGNDTLVGSSAADALRGGLGVDTLTGNGGTDLYYFASSDLQAGFQDRITDYAAGETIRFGAVNPASVSASMAGSDRLLSIAVSGGNAQILVNGNGVLTTVFGQEPGTLSTDLASNFANVTTKGFDLANTNAWLTDTRAYDALQRLDTVDVLNDDGTRVFTDFDQGNARTDTSTQTIYDNLGRTDIVDVRNDNSTRIYTDFDQGSTRADISTLTAYDNLGRVDYVDVRNDNATRIFTDFDQASARADTSTLTAYDNLSRVDYVDVRNDNGTRIFTDFDQANARADASTLTAYDNLSRIDYVDVRNDDGTRVFTDFDQAGARADASTRTLYDNQGRVDIVDVINDDGSRVFTDFDQANANATASTRTVYDTLARIDYIDIIRDDGTRQFTDLDQAGVYSWSSTRTEYAANGSVISVTVVPD